MCNLDHDSCCSKHIKILYHCDLDHSPVEGEQDTDHLINLARMQCVRSRLFSSQTRLLPIRSFSSSTISGKSLWKQRYLRIIHCAKSRLCEMEILMKYCVKVSARCGVLEFKLRFCYELASTSQLLLLNFVT